MMSPVATVPAIPGVDQFISNIRPAGRRLLARVDGAAFLADPRLFVVEECFVERRQVADEVRDFDLDAMHQRTAFEAIPFKSIHLPRGALRLDDNAE